VPQGISYQAVARTANGDELVEETIFIRLSILEGSVDGPISWQEEHSVTTNAFGLFQLIIGNGINTGVGFSSTFEEIGWAEDNHFLQVELDPGDGIYELMGITQLLSVPYSMVAGRALNSDDEDADPTNELITGLSVVDQELVIEEGGQSFSADLGEILSDGDEIVGNESLTLIQLQGTVLNLVESGEAFSVELESLSQDDDWQQNEDAVYNLGDRIGIGTDEPSSSLQVSGSFATKVDIHNTDAPFFLESIHHVLICDLTEGDREVVLPLASQSQGRMYIIKKTALGLDSGAAISNSLSISLQTGDQIEGQNSLLLNSFFREELTLISNGDQWFIISRSNNE
jgi:hypothetical protein